MHNKHRTKTQIVPGLNTTSETVRLHRGDTMSPETRSAVMSRIRGRNTAPEQTVGTMLSDLGLIPELHVRDLPGRPDFVFRDCRIAIFVEGDFWHGWRFPAWRLKLSEKWENKIAANRRRDSRNHSRLRRAGWKVVRIWEHQLEFDPDLVREKLARSCRKKSGGG
jgi:DNA mismatch endonuclease, patch repair protein